MSFMFLNSGEPVLVDEEDRLFLYRFPWTLQNGYAVTRFNGSTLYMHRLILLPTEKATHIDHINGNKLDNRKSNLRYATQKQNALNRIKRKQSNSLYKGVYYYIKRNRYYAKIQMNGIVTPLGAYDTAEEAAKAYDDAALRIHGEFALLNFPNRTGEEA